MNNQDGKPTAKIKLGVFLVNCFNEDPNRELTIGELKEVATTLGINANKIERTLLIEFAGTISFAGNGCYSLNPEWGVQGLLETVNIQRRKVFIEPLELPKPNLRERSGS